MDQTIDHAESVGPFFSVSWDDVADVIRVSWKPGSVLGESEAKAVTAATTRLGRGAAPLLVDIRGVRKLERAAREHFKVDKGGTSALALIVDSPVTKMIANMFMRTDVDQTPTRMFTNDSTAIAWLHDVGHAR